MYDDLQLSGLRAPRQDQSSENHTVASEPTIHKPRVGLIVPSLQVVTEPLYYEVAGDQCEFLTTRLHLKGAGLQDYFEMDESLPRAVRELSTARVDILASCCTASGAIRGYEQERSLCARVQRQTKIPMVATMLSVVEALRFLRAQRIMLVSPYSEEVNEVERSYLARNGFEVVAEVGQGITDGFAMSEVSPEEIARFALDHWDDQADALFMSCMNWRAMRAIPVIEPQIGRPVVTSHNATLWNVLRTLGMDFRGAQYGRWMTAS